MKLCLVAHYAYRALTGQASGHIGGVERQTSLMARWLASRGHEVSVVVWNEGQSPDLSVDGVRVLSVCRQDEGLPGLRFFVPRWTSLRRALSRADAAIYYHNCAEYVTGQVALWARGHARKFVYSVASDPECDPRLDILPKLRERVLFRYGLSHADAVITQTRRQRRMLEEGFGVSSTVLPMPCEVPATEGPGTVARAEDRVLWIGRIDAVKRAEYILEVARECPAVRFELVGPDGGDPEYVKCIRDRASHLPNVSMRGAVNFAEVWHHYRHAAVLCCTSIFEGFPNTFLEAWSQGLPVISTVDPDDVIRTHSLGGVVTSPAECGMIIRQLLSNRGMLNQYSANAKDFFLKNFARDPAMRRFETFFEKIVGDKPRD